MFKRLRRAAKKSKSPDGLDVLPPGSDTSDVEDQQFMRPPGSHTSDVEDEQFTRPPVQTEHPTEAPQWRASSGRKDTTKRSIQGCVLNDNQERTRLETFLPQSVTF
jgi:hypothetical protein